MSKPANEPREEQHAVDLNLATSDQIFEELCRRYRALVLVADGDVIGTQEKASNCGEVLLEYKGNPFTLLGLTHFAMKEINQTIG